VTQFEIGSGGKHRSPSRVQLNLGARKEFYALRMDYYLSVFTILSLFSLVLAIFNPPNAKMCRLSLEDGQPQRNRSGCNLRFFGQAEAAFNMLVIEKIYRACRDYAALGVLFILLNTFCSSRSFPSSNRRHRNIMTNPGVPNSNTRVLMAPAGAR
jgi:hypothetical protein